jgi:hypothetical protein
MSNISPIKHPLPAKPTQSKTSISNAANSTATPASATRLTNSNAATDDRPSTPGATPSLSSSILHPKRPQSPSPYSAANSPKPNLSSSNSNNNSISSNSLGVPGGTDSNWVRPRLDATELNDNSQVVEWGKDWTVKWRKWSSTSLLSSSPNDEDTPISLDHEFATTIDPLNAQQTTGPARPRAVRLTSTTKNTKSVLHESDDDGIQIITKSDSAVAPIPNALYPTSSSSASTSKRSLDQVWDRLHFVDDAEVESDAIEEACRVVATQAEQIIVEEAKGQQMRLFSYVEVDSSRLTDLKGKGKAGEAITRDLWVFAIVANAAEHEMELDSPGLAEVALDSLRFDRLTRKRAPDFMIRLAN